MAYKLGLTEAFSQSIRTEYALRTLGNTGRLTVEQIRAIAEEVRRTSKDTAQQVDGLISALQTMVSKGLDPSVAKDFLQPLGKTATAQSADVNDLALTAYTNYANLGVKLSEVRQEMEIMARSGDLGGFEIKDMSKYFPELGGPASSALGLKGLGGVAQLAAALQVAMIQAGDASTAANNMQNFLMKITANETVRNFRKFGVDVEQEIKKALASGADPLEHMLNLIQQITGGNDFKVQELFVDQQVRQFIGPMMRNLEKYKEIRDISFGSRGFVDQNFINMMNTTQKQLEQLKINLNDLIMPDVNGFFKRLNGHLKDLNTNSRLLKVGLGGVVALFGGGVLLSGIGLTFQGLAGISAGLAAMGIALAPGLAIIGLFVAGGIAVVYWWDRVVENFTKAWTLLKEIAKLLSGITGAQKLISWVRGEDTNVWEPPIVGAYRNIQNSTKTSSANVTYAPVINMPAGASRKDWEEANNMFRIGQADFDRMLNRHYENLQRTEY